MPRIEISYLLRRARTERAKERSAACAEARFAHEKLKKGYQRLLLEKRAMSRPLSRSEILTRLNPLVDL